jgi:hypothetical protein
MWLVGAAVVVAVLGTAGVWAALRLSEPTLRARAIDMLEERFHSDVELKEFHVSVFPGVRVEGSGLALRKDGRTDVPPLIALERFSAQAGLRGMLGKPWKIEQIKLKGLVITVPPKSQRPPRDYSKHKKIPIWVGEIVSTDAKLITLPKSADKAPHEFDIHTLVMHSVGLDPAASFTASLTNATPPGQIETQGSFGPWNTDDPGETPLAANYTFSQANLDVFKGIGGILSSKGKFGGVLEKIEVEGETHTPDFVVDISGHPVSLDTTFSATVDGTNGNTILHPVRAHFLNSSLTANGEIVKTRDGPGRRVTLDVVFDKGRIEDLLRLAVKNDKPILTGDVKFHAKFDLPSRKVEPQDVTERLNLDGQFGVTDAEFTSPKVSARLQSFSRKAEGKPEDEDAGSDVSQLKGQFHLDHGIIAFRNLSFAIPGANMHLDGTYGLKSEKIDFEGKLLMKAKVSQTTTGVKAFFLKLVDPLFRKNGRTDIPIKITGTRQKPSFGLRLGDGDEKDKGSE